MVHACQLSSYPRFKKIHVTVWVATPLLVLVFKGIQVLIPISITHILNTQEKKSSTILYLIKYNNLVIYNAHKIFLFQQFVQKTLKCLLDLDITSCVLCFNVEEEVNHLFLSCSFSYMAWCEIYELLGFAMVSYNVITTSYTSLGVEESSMQFLSQFLLIV